MEEGGHREIIVKQVHGFDNGWGEGGDVIDV